MSKLSLVLGNEQPIAALSAALRAGTLPHAVLLAAPDGCGRNFAARCLAADYLYPVGGTPADAVLRGEGAEVLLVQGEGKSGQIPVARIREMRAAVFHSSLSAEGRVVLVRNAHHMAAPAANALLKVLEEPPAGVLFILTTHSPAALFPTIVSRTAVYTLAPPPADVCRQALAAHLPAGEDPALVPLLATLYDSRLGLAQKALQNPARLAIIRHAMAAATAAAARNSYGMLHIFAQYEGRADEDRTARDALLGDMTDIFSACLRGQTAPGLVAMPPAAAALLLPPVADTRRALAGNAAPKLAFTALAVQLEAAGR